MLVVVGMSAPVTNAASTEKDELTSLNSVSVLSTKECLNLRRGCFVFLYYSHQFHPSSQKRLPARVPLADSGLNVITSHLDHSSANVIEMEVTHLVN